MNKKELIILGLVYITIQALLNLGVFVTFPQMTAYAAPRGDITKIEAQLTRIEDKVDSLILRL